jgi:predicted AAA+ superfamily ATPase
MHYIPRHLALKLQEAYEQEKIVLLLGARQVGKSTLLRHCFPDIQYFVLDAVFDEYSLKTQADLFLKSFPPPLILDEVQFYPEVLSALKRFVDRRDQNGQYLLTGSQNFSMLKTVSESMAGRVAILELNPMTFLERYNITSPYWIDLLLADQALVGAIKPAEIPDSIYDILWRGQLPGRIDKKDSYAETFFSSYIRTYIERDVRLLADIKNLDDFSKFVRLIAMLSGQEINAAELGRELGIANSTALLWKSLLKNSFLWNELEPYHGNTIKRLSKKSKGFFFDTGLLCHLSMIDSALALAKHPRIGAIFETFMVNTLLYYLKARAACPIFSHWRMASGYEVDLVLEHQGKLYPIEIKFKAHIDSHDLRGLESFMKTYSNAPLGVIVYAGEICRYVADNIIAVPWNGVQA